MPVCLETPGYLFVHAGIRPGVALADQTDADLLWVRDAFLNHSGTIIGKPVVHGHTPSRLPEVLPYRINCDTAAFMGGPLTAVRLAGGTVTVLQEN